MGRLLCADMIVVQCGARVIEEHYDRECFVELHGTPLKANGIPLKSGPPLQASLITSESWSHLGLNYARRRVLAGREAVELFNKDALRDS